MNKFLTWLPKQLRQRVTANPSSDVNLANANRSDDSGRRPVSYDALGQSLEALEQRIMLDAAAVATTADALADQVATEQAQDDLSVPPVVQQQKEALREALAASTAANDRTEIVFIDRSVEGYEDLLGGIAESAEVIVIDGDQDGVELIASALQGRSDIDAIHIISHGEAGQLNLGNATLTHASIQGEYADELQAIGGTLSSQADILLYGCNFAQGDVGRAAADALSEITGADIAASNDLTGASDLGGDWDLEAKLGQIESLQLAESFATIEWQHTLALAVTDSNSVTDAAIVDIVSQPGNGINTSLPADATPNTDNLAIGTYTDFQDSNGTTLASGVVISTGDINQLPGDANGAGNFAFSFDNASTDVDDADLDTVGPAFDQFDVGTLTYDFTSDVKKIAVQYVFATEETAFYGPTHTDIFGVYITDQTTGITTTIASNDIQTEYTSGGFMINSPDANPNVETTANTAILTATLDLSTLSGFGSGSDYTIKFVIADQTDASLDSAAFISHFGAALILDNDGDDSSGTTGSDYSTTFTDGSGGIAVVDSDVSVTNYSTGSSVQTATINLTNPSAGDQLIDAGVNAANFTVAGSGTNSITITAIGTQSEANWEAALQQIEYNNTLVSPTVVTDRTVDIILNDGVTDSNVATTTIEINDVTAPALPTINAPIEVDNIVSGAEDDDVLVTGTAEPSTTVTVVFDDGVNPAVSVSVVTDAMGNWTLTGNEADISGLNQGNINVSATATDAANNSSMAATTSVTHDSAVTAPTVNSQSTNDTTPVITGTFDETDYTPGNGDLQITVTGPGPTNLTFDDTDPEVSTDGAGNWTLDLSAIPGLGDGTYEVSASITDPAGNSATDVSTGELVIDTMAPAVPVVNSISTDTGASGTDGITSDNTLLIGGTAEANSTVEVFVDGVSIGTTMTDASGNWTFDHTGTVLPDGDYDITATATDAAMNASALSAALPITVDTTVTAPTVAPQTTANTSPVITGTFDASDAAGGFTVTVDGTTYTLGADPELTAIGDTWSLDLDAAGQVLPGPYPASFDVVATATDSAGNVASDATAAEISVDPSQNVDAVDDVLASINANGTSTGSLPGLLANDINQITPGATLDFDASNEADTTNTIWEDNVGTSGFDWDFSGGGVAINNTPGSSFGGITASYTFDGTGGAGFSDGAGSDDSFSNIAGDPTNNDASFEVWFKAAADADEDVIFETGASGDGLSLSINGAVLSLKIKDGGVNIQRTFDLATIGIDPTAEFVQVAWTYDQDIDVAGTDRVIMYVNGNAVLTDVTQTGLNDWAGSNDAGLGSINSSINFGSGGAFEGDIAIFRFYESVLTANDVLDNFEVVTDVDANANTSHDGLTVNAFDATSTEGATVVVNADGSYSYDPSTSAAIQALNPGESIVDTFTYTIIDETGLNTDTATVSIEVFGAADASLSVTQQGDEDGPQDIIYTVSLDAGKTNETGADITFDLNFTGGTASFSDITNVSGAGVITIADGANTGTLTVPVMDDLFDEGAETVEATISNASNSSIAINVSNAIATIDDNDSGSGNGSGNDIDFAISSTSDIDENGETATFDITVTGQIPINGFASVDITSSGSADSGVDYDNFIAAIVTAAAGTTGVSFDGVSTLTFSDAFVGPVFSFMVDSIPDALIEGDETIVATLGQSIKVSGLSGSSTTIQGFGGTVAGTLDDGFAYDPTDPTGTFPDIVYNTGDGFHSDQLGDAVIDYTLAEDFIQNEGNDFVIDLYGRNSHQDRDDDIDIEIFDGSGVSLGVITGVAIDADSHVRVNVTQALGLMSGATVGSFQLVAHDSDGNTADDNHFTLMEIRASNIPTTTAPDLNTTISVSTATVTINDDDDSLEGVTISATDATASEDGTDNGEFTIDLGEVNNTGADIVVSYSIAGTATDTDDYTTLTGTVTIADGQQTATIDVTGVADTLVEGDETVVATITGTDNALFTVDGTSDEATVTISDDDDSLEGVTISATDATASEDGTDNGEFTVDLGAVNNTGADIVVSYSVAGTATATDDYTALTGTVTIANGQQTATIDVAGIVDDALVEGSETVIATITVTDNALFTVDAANDDATVTISDNDNSLAGVTISATDATASEDGTDNGEFTVDLGAVNNTGADIEVTYTIAGTATPGTDYTPLTGTVTIAAGQQTATIDVAGITDDTLVEGDETVVVTVTGTDNVLFTPDAGNSSATVTIGDSDDSLEGVTISATDATASEDGTDNGEFTVDLGAVNNTGADIVVSYSIAGTATGTDDYTALTGTVTIADGQQTATIDVAGIVDDALVEGDETVIATITGTDNVLFTVDAANDDATVTISDDDDSLEGVTISATDATASEDGTDNGQFTVDLGEVNNTGADIVVSYSIAGTATGTDDYTALTGTVTIADGQQTATIDVTGVADTLVEGDETVVATITGTDNALFTVDAANDEATVTISDDDDSLNGVSVTANDPTASETATDNGQFTIDLGEVNNTGEDIVVTYTIAGTATPGTDYTPLTGTVTIAAGQQTATIDVAGITDDTLVEGDETVVVTVTGTDNVLFTPDAGNSSATVTIGDSDDSLEGVTISATDATASEDGTDNGEFTIDLGAVNNTGADIVVSYSIAGTATGTDDYTALTGTVTIADGQQTATIDVAGIVDDALVEGDETVVATITGTDNVLFTVDGTSDEATVTISDDDDSLEGVTISATDATASEDGTDNGEFTIDLGEVNNTGADIVVSYSIAGTATGTDDYTALTGTVTIADGQQTATIDVTGVADTLVEGDETVVATITGTDNVLFTVDGSSDEATVTINDDDDSLNGVSVTANDPTASETATDNGQFTIDLGEVNNTGEDIVVTYTIAGTATPGTDYTPLTGTVTIAAGQQTATIDVAGITDDTLVEGDETVVVTVTGTDNVLFTPDTGNSSATVTIGDSDDALESVTISATDATASEDGTDNGEFTIDLGEVNNTGADIVVSYSIAGTATGTDDYTALTGTVTIADGQQTATIDVTGVADTLVEGDETVVATITGTDNALFTVDGTSDEATVTISDDDDSLEGVTISATDATASEDGTDNGEFTIDLGEVNNTGEDIVVTYTIAGTATDTDDYTTLTGTVTIADGQQTATIDVTGVADTLVEGDETVVATITGTDNALFTVNGTSDEATVTISDDDDSLEGVTISATDAAASEDGTDNGEFTVDLGAVNNTGADIVVTYTIAGTATPGTDYTALTGTVTIADGQQTATIDVAGIVDDALVEGDETVVATVTVTDNALFTVNGTSDEATVTISDDDDSLEGVTISATDATASEDGTDNGEFTIDLGEVNNTGADIVVSYSIAGTATGTDDYTALTGTVTIADGQQTATIDVAGIVDDALVEGDETVVATITGTDNVLFTVDGSSDEATVTINDDDDSLNGVSVTANDPTASETATDNGQFTIDLGEVNNTGEDIVVTYTIAGTATPGTDYTPLTGTVTIAAGQQTATIDVAGITDDTLVEGDETVVVTVTGTDNVLFTPDTGNSSATVTIGDSDDALESVTISATDATASEDGTDNGEFTIDLGEVNNTGADIVVSYSIAGTATGTDDYTALTGTVTIADGQQTATIDVAGIVDDALVEGDETVVVTVTGTDNVLFTPDTGNSSATVTIGDSDDALESVTISATDATASEDGTDNGEFTIDLGEVNNTGADIVVSYSIAGTATGTDDYTALTGTVTIADGQQTATIDVTGVADTLVEGDETVVATITGTDNALFTVDGTSDEATVTISDDDDSLEGVTISATDATASEDGTDNGEFTIDLGEVNNTGEDIVVTYTIAGTATDTDDYTTLTGTVTIADGQQTATIDVTGVADTLVEGDETVVATITGTDNALFTVNGTSDEATVTISDDDDSLEGVTISATDAAASEDGTDNGEFTVDLGAVNNTGADIVVTYTIAGTATPGTDYTALTGTVTIADGQQTATIDVAGIVDDALVEGDETVVATVTVTDNALFTVNGTSDEATVTISDDDDSLEGVTISATDATASEDGTDNGEFTIDLGEVNNTGADIVVSYSIAGTATGTDDYTALTGTVTIADGQQTATIDVAGIVDDALVEGDETVVATITGTDNVLFTVDGSSDEATVTINDDDDSLNGVSVTANDPTASETATDNGQFTIDLGEVNNTGEDIVVTYTIAGTATPGTDYTPLTGTVTIAAGQQTATIDVAGITDDTLVEGDETVVVTVTGTDNVLFTPDTGNSSATVTIGDSDDALESVTISATDATASEDGTDNGEFTIDLGEVNNTGADIVVSYSIAGTATGTDDYTALTGTVTIADGQQTATIDVAGIVDDALVEGDETVVVTVTGTDNVLFTPDTGNSSATVTIGDSDDALESVTISATDATASEDGTDNGEFTIDLGEVNNTGADIVVSYSIAGTATGTDDYTALTGTVTIADGQQTATIDVTGVADTLVEGDETVVATITGTDNALFTVDGTSDEATVTISDDDDSLEGVTISATDATASEDGTDNGEFTIDLGEVNNTGADIVVTYTIAGTATDTDDYTTLTGTVTIADGEQTATIDVTGVADTLVEGDETVVATITGTDNALFTVNGTSDEATVTISDDDDSLEGVTISATDAAASEDGTDNGEFTVDLGAVNNTGADIVVTYTIAGTATPGTDYTALTGTVTIADGQQTATIDVAGIVDDALVEGDETVVATITGTDNVLFTVDGTSDEATVTISDDDDSLEGVTISATDATASEDGTDNGEFTIDLGEVNNTGADIVVSYSIAGTATDTDDYTTLTGTVTIADGQQTATIDVAGIVDDALVEGDETVVATITGTDNVLFTVDGSSDEATVTINDDDDSLNGVSVTANDPTASETATDNGQFTIDLGEVNNTGEDIVVTYTIAGTATPGTDYTPLTGTVTIAAGQQTATIDVAGITDDTLVEGDETVVVTVTGTDNVLFTPDTGNSSATVTIGDSDDALESVTISATDATASEDGTDNGEFTIDLGEVNNTGADIVVSYSIAGTATGTDDYTALTGTVTIADGQQTATIDVAGIVDDALVEGDETVIATITGTDNVLFTVDGTSDEATVTISDDDDSLEGVTISATDATASEDGTDNGEFTIDLGEVNNTGADIVVSYSIAGTATGTDDYTALTGTVTIADGQQTATIDVTGVADTLVEGDETVIATITGTDNVLFTVNGTSDEATVTISDDDDSLEGVTISATDATASEDGTDNGEFTIDLGEVNNTGADIVVSYSIAGTATDTDDYTTLTGTVTIADGEQTATIDVTGVADTLVEGDETVVATITGTDNVLFTVDGTSDEATVTINDDDDSLNGVSVTANDSTASETATDNGQFTIDLGEVNNTGEDIVVTYTIAGTATPGTDYTPLTGTVTIAAGQQTATIDVAGITDDTLVEGDETVVVTVTGTDNVLFTPDTGNSSATVTIGDSDDSLEGVTISATDATASEDGTDNGEFTIDLGEVNNTGADIVVSYSIAGTATGTDDYTALTGTVTIADGQQTATIDVTGVADTLVEGDETVVATITGTDNVLFTVDGTSDEATVTINDDDDSLNGVSVTANDSTASETATDNGQFTIDLGEVNNTGEDIVVTYTIAGTATPGTDYTPLTGTVTIAAGQQTATIDVAGITDDTLVEGDETVVVTVTGTDNVLFTPDTGNSSATVTIGDSDDALESVTISATDATASEDGTDNGEFTIDLGEVNNTGADIVVSYSIAGTATGTDDYTALTGTVTIADGQQTATIDVTGVADTLVEGDETVVATITGTDNALFTVDGTSDEATVTISDDDDSLEGVTISATDATASEDGTDNGEFTIDLGEVNNTGEDIVVTYTIAGTATDTDDYTTLTGTVTIAAGQQTATIDVTGVADTLVEGDETVVATITGTDNVLFTVNGTSDEATVTISDDDDSLEGVSVTANDSTASETATDNGQFTIDLGEVNNTGEDIVVTYTIAGTATPGTDYTPLTGTVTIAAGQQTATIDVAGITDDTLVEGDETVVVTVTGTDNVLFTPDAGNSSATVTIGDSDDSLEGVTITATDPTASETATDNGEFTIDLGAVNNTGAPIIVSYSISGTATTGTDYTTLAGGITDFTTLTGIVLIADGQQTATIGVANIIDDTLLEGNETVVMTVTGTDNALFTPDAGNDSATVTINDNDDASITITDVSVNEAAGTITFTATLDNAVLNGFTVDASYTDGSAVGGVDFGNTVDTLTFAGTAGETQTFTVAITDDAIVEGDENFTVNFGNVVPVTAPLIAIDASDTAVGTIVDNDSATVSIAAVDAAAAEPGDNGQFVVNLSNVSSTDTVVNYTVSGNATDGSDFAPLSGSVTILAGQTSAVIDVSVIDDALLEGDETAVITLSGIASGDADITIGAANSDVVTISDTDTAVVSIAVTDPAVTEEGDAGQLTVNISNPSDTDTVITYTVTGSATNGTDYQTLTGTVTIPAGSTSATIDVTPIDDDLSEGDESITVTLTGITSGDPDIAIGGTSSSTLTIADNGDDDPVVNVVPENLLNLDGLSGLNSNANQAGGVGVGFDQLRAPGAVIDAVDAANSEVFGDQLSSFGIDETALDTPGTLTGFVYRSAVAETGTSGLSSVFPLRIGETDTELNDRDQLLIRSWSINHSLFLEVLYVDASGYDLQAISVSQADGSALPEWMSFDAATGLLSGSAPQDQDNVKLRVVVELSGGVEVLRYIEVDVNNAEITEISEADDLKLSGVQPFSNQVDVFAKQFAGGDYQ